MLQVYSVTTTLTYTARLSDSGSRVQCTVDLVDDLKHVTSISSDSRPRLTVSEAGGSGGGSGELRDWQIVLAVILPIVFIVCLAGLILAICYHKRKTKSKADNNVSNYQGKYPPPYIDIDSIGKETSSNSVVIVTEEVAVVSEEEDAEDVATVFSYEGEVGSRSGSLSSIVSESEAESIYHSIARLGGKFGRLAKIYKEDDENTESDNGIYNGTVPSNLGLESWV